MSDADPRSNREGASTTIGVPKFYNVYEECLGVGDGSKRVCLQIGSPGAHFLKDVARLMKVATAKHFEDSNPRNDEILQYGVCAGNWNFREELAKFLTQCYRNPVYSCDLFVNSGASQGIANLLYHYFQQGETLYVEDPSYWNFTRTFDATFYMKPVGIGLDEEGLRVDELEKKLENLEPRKTSDRYPYRAAVYVVPVHQNPTGVIMSEERCQRLLEVARKYDLLIISDDIYNVLTYWAPDHDDPVSAKPPTRLFWYDKKSDPDYKGSVVSVSSVSKFLAPGLRVGWYEMPEKMIRSFSTYFITDSGSGWNEYTSGILAWAFHLGLVKQHVDHVRKQRWSLLNRVREVVADRLVKKYDITCSRPTGGCFLWITLPKGFSADRLLEKCNHEVTFVPGSRCTVTNSHLNGLRICVAFYDEDILFPAVSKLCNYIEKFIQ